ncbi:MAG TPA: helix-turn-helix transcriptional regulator [Candidatus Limnocylindrales bacterium]|nr:helix-turn-helix transcriptional regulator [Candidatus Limnocylindrales bacterium]
MQTSTDTFLGFIDVLAAALGDGADDDAGELRATDFASRASLSRFHFDRLISAAAGEPPGRFRRRILLERSAYRLLDRRTGILDVAIEAGYASNEAFTRAFRRAYGRAPSEWRDAPRQIRLPSPNDVHFHPPGGLRLPARTEVSDMNLLVRMVEHHVWLLGQLLDRADRIDPAFLDAPIELSVEGIDDQPTMRSLLSRLVGQMDMWNNVIHDRPYDMAIEQGESLSSIRRRLDQAGPAFLDEVRRVTEERRLDETFIDAHCEPPEVFTYGGLIAHVLTFAAFRRLLVLGALYRAGITDLEAGDPRKWVEEAA